MKKQVQIYFVLPLYALMLITIAFFGCNKATKLNEPALSFHSTSIPQIYSISKPTEIDIKTFNIYLDKAQIKNDGSLSIDEVITYLDNPIRSIILKHSLISVDSSFVIIMSDEDDNFIDYYIDIKVLIEGNQIGFYSSNTLVASILFDPVGLNEIEYIVYSPGGSDFIRCFRTALNACLQDPECAFLCGIVWKQCLSAIAAACAYHTFINPNN